MADIKLNELGQKAGLFLTDLLAVAGSDGTLYGSNLQQFANFFSTTSGLEFKGKLLISETPVKGWYIAGEAGTYTNAGGLVVSLTNNICIIIVPTLASNSTKIDIPLSLNLETTAIENNENGITSGGVHTIKTALEAVDTSLQTQINDKASVASFAQEQQDRANEDNLRILKTKINNSLTSTDETEVLAATQGKILKDNADALNVSLNGGTVPVTITFPTTGGLSVTNGSEVASSEQRRTGFIDILDADSINYANLRGFEGSTFSMLYLYDESYAGIASIVANNTSGTIRSGVVDIKNNYPTTKYYRMALNANPSYLAAVTSSLVYLGSLGSLSDDIAINTANIVTNNTNISNNLTEINKIKNQKSVKRQKIYTQNLLSAGNITKSAAKTQPNLYNAIVNNLPNPIFRGSSPLRQNTGTYPSEFYLNADVFRFTSYILEFNFTGRHIEIAGRETSYTFSLLVNGVMVVKNQASTGSEGNDAQGKKWINVDLGATVTNAHVKLSFYGNFGGIATDGSLSVFSATRPKINVDGDSIMEGSAGAGSSSAPNILGYSGVMAYLLDCDLYNAAVGGSGFVALGNGGQPALGGRFATYVQPYECDVFAFSAGLNDGYTAYGVEDEEAVIAYFEQVYQAYKNTKTKVIVISPFDPLSSTPKTNNLGVIGIRNLEKTLCLQYRWGFIDIMDGITYDEIGNIVQDSSLTLGGMWDNGRRATMNFDGTHPNELGHNYIGYRVANEIYRLIG